MPEDQNYGGDPGEVVDRRIRSRAAPLIWPEISIL
jgi:hypothetical protein